MIFKELSIPGVFLISLERYMDERGFFARSFCKKEFGEQGLCTDFLQCNISYNEIHGTLRGIHYQEKPYGEVKVVSCAKGAVYDIVLDLRIDSPTFRRWISIELNDENNYMLYLPIGVGHGFQTLMDHTFVYYQMGTVYVPSAARGIRYNDPYFAVDWPIKNPIISVKDRGYSLWNENGDNR